MKILIADKLADNAINGLKALGAELNIEPDLKTRDLAKHLSGVEILIVRSTKVSKEVIENAPDLALIIRAGAGVNTIDVETASTRGIHVANCPGRNKAAVAELAIGLMIAVDRNIVDATNDLRNGKWRKKLYGKGYGLKNRTLGIVGLGNIGSAVATRAKALKMNVIAYSRSLTPEKAGKMGIGYCSDLNEIAKKSDVVSLHIAATQQTKHLISTGFFEQMRDSAILINTSRGEIVDTQALKNAITTKQLRVGLDVYENEPAGGENDFTDTGFAQQIVCTPHIGASTAEASEAIAAEVVKIAASYQQTGKPVNAINIRSKSETGTTVILRHYSRVGVLATVLNAFKNEGINIEEMDNTIFNQGKAAICTLLLDNKPSNEVIQELRMNENLIQLIVK